MVAILHVAFGERGKVTAQAMTRPDARPSRRVAARVRLGTFDCGDRAVHIERNQLWFLPNPACPLPNGVGIVALSFTFDTVEECTVDKATGEMAFQVMVDVPGDAAPEYFAPCKHRDHPGARVRIRPSRADEWEVFTHASRTLQRKTRFRALGESSADLAAASPIRPNVLDDAQATVQSLHAERVALISDLHNERTRVGRQVAELMLLLDAVASERANSKETLESLRTVLAEAVENRAQLQRRAAEQIRAAEAEALRRRASDDGN